MGVGRGRIDTEVILQSCFWISDAVHLWHTLHVIPFTSTFHNWQVEFYDRQIVLVPQKGCIMTCNMLGWFESSDCGNCELSQPHDTVEYCDNACIYGSVTQVG